MNRATFMTWRAVVAACAAAVLLAPGVVLGQTAEPTRASAWWANVGQVDDSVRCAAQLAWLQAVDVEQRDEEQGSTEQLADVTTGAELVREQQRVSARASPSDRTWASYSTWTLVGGSSQEMVLYATSVRRAGPPEVNGAERADAEWVDRLEAAYRLVLENGAWRLADRHVFEEGRHALDYDAARRAVEEYQRLFDGLRQAYNARDLDGLETVLAGPALEQYRSEVQQLQEQHDQDSIRFTGHLGMIDTDRSTATMAFEGMRTRAGPDDGDAAPATAEPVTLVHRLVLTDGEWKIVDEFEATTHRDADGSEHIQGCG